MHVRGEVGSTHHGLTLSLVCYLACACACRPAESCVAGVLEASAANLLTDRSRRIFLPCPPTDRAHFLRACSPYCSRDSFLSLRSSRRRRSIPVCRRGTGTRRGRRLLPRQGGGKSNTRLSPSTPRYVLHRRRRPSIPSSQRRKVASRTDFFLLSSVASPDLCTPSLPPRETIVSRTWAHLCRLWGSSPG